MNDPIMSGGMYAVYIFGGLALLLFVGGVWYLLHTISMKKNADKRYETALRGYSMWREFLREKRAESVKIQTESPLTYDRDQWEWTNGHSWYAPPQSALDEYDALGDGRNSSKDQREPRLSEFRPDSDDWGFSVVLVVVGLVVGMLVSFAAYPFKSEYHQWRVVEGVVTAADGGQIKSVGDSGDLSVDYAFTIDGKQYVCDETRCSSVKTGDTAKFRCKPDYRWAGSPINKCSFVSVRKS